MHTVILLYERKLYTSTTYWHCPHRTWPIDAVVRALDLRPRRSWVRLLASCFQVTTLGKLFTHTCASVTKQCNMVLCPSIRLSVSMGPQQQTHYCRLVPLGLRWDRRYQLNAATAVGECGSAVLSVYIGS